MTIDNDESAGSALDDSGFGMVEIVVAMLMFALLAVSFLPLLIQGLQMSATNATRATATQVLHDRIEYAQSQTLSCTALKSLLQGTSSPVVEDPRGISFDVVTDVATCPTNTALYPTTVVVDVKVLRHDALSDGPLSEAKTLIYVSKLS